MNLRLGIVAIYSATAEHRHAARLQPRAAPAARRAGFLGEERRLVIWDGLGVVLGGSIGAGTPRIHAVVEDPKDDTKKSPTKRQRVDALVPTERFRGVGTVACEGVRRVRSA